MGSLTRRAVAIALSLVAPFSVGACGEGGAPGLAPGLLCLEITESNLMATADVSVRALCALKDLGDGHGELKSMHTTAAARGRGVGGAIVVHLVDVAITRGMTRVSLETGTPEAFAPARSLYASHGFVECGPFGDYLLSPWSTFMTRAL